MSINLSGADTSTPKFIPVRAGTYDATIFEATWGELQGGPTAKLPKGTQYINVQFKLDLSDDATDVEGKSLAGADRRVFNRYILAPEKIGNKAYEHKAKMDGMLVRFLEAIGYDKDEVMSEKGFDPDLADFAGRTCAVIVNVESYVPNDPEYDDNDEPIKAQRNTVKGVKAGTATSGRKAGALL